MRTRRLRGVLYWLLVVLVSLVRVAALALALERRDAGSTPAIAVAARSGW